jgi:hypothetical protein
MPELQFHAHDRGKLSVSLLAGVLLAILIGRLEHESHAADAEPPLHRPADPGKQR